MKRLACALSLLLPTAADAAICRHNGGYWPASSYSTCPECALEGKIPQGYKWYNAHLAPSGTAAGVYPESGQQGWPNTSIPYTAPRWVHDQQIYAGPPVHAYRLNP